MIAARLNRLRPAQAVGVTSLAFLGGAGIWLLFRFDPAAHGFYPVCFLHQTTGLQCPGCGSLRAMHQLLHGHLAAAWSFNPLLVSTLPLAAVLAVRFAVLKSKGQDAWNIPPAWLWSILVIGIAFGIARNFW
jgi:hypothetical protein